MKAILPRMPALWRVPRSSGVLEARSAKTRMRAWAALCDARRWHASSHRSADAISARGEHAPLTMKSPRSTTETSSPSSPDLEAAAAAWSPAASRDEDTSWKQRMQRFMVEYGKVGICTHAVLSVVSFSGIYFAIRSGVDVSAVLQSLGLHQVEVASSAGPVLVAYGVYKLLMPVRWPLTFAVTPIVARALRIRRTAAQTQTPQQGTASTAPRGPPPDV